MTLPAKWGRLAFPLALLLLLGVGALTRFVPAADLVYSIPGDVRFFDSDSYYHLRHTQFAVAHFPDLQRYDVGTHYPTGHRSEAAGLFDLATAAAALLVGLGDPPPQLVDHVAALMPVLLGLLALWAAVALVRRLAGLAAALVTGLILTLLPGPFLDRTLVGFFDHHAAEVLLGLLSTAGAAACLFGPERQGYRAWTWPLLYAAPMAAFVFTWAGGPIQLVVLGAAIFGLILVDIAWYGARRELAWRVVRYSAALVLLVGLPALLWPRLVLIPRLLLPFLAAAAALAGGSFLLLALGRRLLAWGWRPWRAAAAVFALVAAAAAVALILLLPRASWIGMLVEKKHELVQEHYVVGPDVLFRVLGVPGLLALAAVPVWALLARRRRESTGARAALFTALVGCGWLFLWVQTYDYNYAAPVWSAVLCGLSVGGVQRWLTERPARKNGRRPAHRLALGLALLLALATLLSFAAGTHRIPLLSAAEVRTLNVYDAGWSQAMRWMARITPRPTLPVDANVDSFDGDFQYSTGTYGVLVAWSWGNIVAARGERVPVSSQGVFPASRAAARWMFLTDEAESLSFWDEVCETGERFRYVVLDAETLADHFVATANSADLDALAFMARGDDGLPRYGRAYVQTMAGRLFFGLGSELSHYRLVYQTPHETHLYYRAVRVEGEGGRTGTSVRLRSDPLDTPEEEARYRRFTQGGLVRDGDERYYGSTRVPSVRIFEIVAGATVTGTAPAGTTVRANLQLRSRADGAAFDYRRSVTVAEDDRFELTLPYSTDGAAPSNVAALGRYQLELVVDGRATPVRQLDISEDRVQSGARLDIGELRVE